MEQNSPRSPFWVVDIRSGYYQIPITDFRNSGALKSHTANCELINCDECKRLKNELEICNKRLEESKKAGLMLLREITDAELTLLNEIRAQFIYLLL